MQQLRIQQLVFSVRALERTAGAYPTAESRRGLRQRHDLRVDAGDPGQSCADRSTNPIADADANYPSTNTAAHVDAVLGADRPPDEVSIVNADHGVANHAANALAYVCPYHGNTNGGANDRTDAAALRVTYGQPHRGAYVRTNVNPNDESHATANLYPDGAPDMGANVVSVSVAIKVSVNFPINITVCYAKRVSFGVTVGLAVSIAHHGPIRVTVDFTVNRTKPVTVDVTVNSALDVAVAVAFNVAKRVTFDHPVHQPIFIAHGRTYKLCANHGPDLGPDGGADHVSDHQHVHCAEKRVLQQRWSCHHLIGPGVVVHRL